MSMQIEYIKTINYIINLKGNSIRYLTTFYNLINFNNVNTLLL